MMVVLRYDHVGVGTGTVINRPAIKQYQEAMRVRAGDKISGGKIIKVGYQKKCVCEKNLGFISLFFACGELYAFGLLGVVCASKPLQNFSYFSLIFPDPP